MSVEHRFTYKEVDTVVELCRPPEEGGIRIVSPAPTKEVIHEVLFVAIAIVHHFRKTGEVLSVEQAIKEVALQYLTEERYGDIANLTPQELAGRAEITEELASFRIELTKG